MSLSTGRALARALSLGTGVGMRRIDLKMDRLEGAGMLSTDLSGLTVVPGSKGSHAVTATSGPAGYSPGQIRVAYGLDTTNCLQSEHHADVVYAERHDRRR